MAAHLGNPAQDQVSNSTVKLSAGTGGITIEADVRGHIVELGTTAGDINLNGSLVGAPTSANINSLLSLSANNGNIVIGQGAFTTGADQTLTASGAGGITVNGTLSQLGATNMALDAGDCGNHGGNGRQHQR